jgi:hypothetical protein
VDAAAAAITRDPGGIDEPSHTGSCVRLLAVPECGGGISFRLDACDNALDSRA